MGVWGELKEDYVKVIEELGNERMKGKEDTCLQNYLVEGHVTVRRKMRSLIPSGPASQMPQPIFRRDESQFLGGKPTYPVLIKPPNELAPSDHQTSYAST